MPLTDSMIDVFLVRGLIQEQFPEWAHLPIRPVEHSGWDNRTFHLGPQMLVRLPSAEHYVSQVSKEHKWLPILSPHLPFSVPTPLALGAPNKLYPWPWSIYNWIEGETVATAKISDLSMLALDLSAFLTSMKKIKINDGPGPGLHNFHRGGSLSIYEFETLHALSILKDKIDCHIAMNVWKNALKSSWEKSPVWVHGDISSGNLIVKENRLKAVIDFGCLAIGDPACDLTIAWTLFDKKSRETFCSNMNLDQNTWDRARGWTLWKALINCEKNQHNQVEFNKSLKIINAVS